MSYSLNDIEDILFDGDEPSISSLSDMAKRIPLAYEYSPSTESFCVQYGNLISRSKGVLQEPNCVSVFGLEHSF